MCIRDSLGQIVDLCIKKDDLGFQVFNAGNDHNGAILPTKDLIDRFFPGVPVSRKLGEHEALSVSYTHLDVYKRQLLMTAELHGKR